MNNVVYCKVFNPFKFMIVKEDSNYTAKILYRHFDTDHIKGFYKEIYNKKVRDIKTGLVLFKTALTKIKNELKKVA